MNVFSYLSIKCTSPPRDSGIATVIELKMSSLEMSQKPGHEKIQFNAIEEKIHLIGKICPSE